MAELVSSLRTSSLTLEKPLRLIADLEAERAATLAKQAELEAAIAQAPDWRGFADGRDRDREWQRQSDLKLQLRLLHENRLLAAPGQVLWDVSSLDARIAELNARIAQLRAQHDAHVEAAEALLGETVAT